MSFKEIAETVAVLCLVGFVFYVGASIGVQIGCSSGIYETARFEKLDVVSSKTIEDYRVILEKRCLNEEGSHKNLR